MAHITINQYLQQVYDAIDNHDGSFCAELLSFKHPHVANPDYSSPVQKKSVSSFWSRRTMRWSQLTSGVPTLCPITTLWKPTSSRRWLFNILL
ncbi:hypothetical protein EPR50_G00243870 [Perca flavescens]|uniref:Uncharacterized protein n=1 Tax=Perca flavescens TaxID=8167 RepID=A0A484C2W0_PERFV|nr:hypothetical protein EPR50_G00243870 [Perca flavescens]